MSSVQNRDGMKRNSDQWDALVRACMCVIYYTTNICMAKYLFNHTFNQTDISVGIWRKFKQNIHLNKYAYFYIELLCTELNVENLVMTR